MTLGILPRRHLHRRLGGAQQRSGKERQTQVDGGRVQRVRRLLQLEAKAVAEVEFARLHDRALGKFGVDMPIACLVGIGKPRACDRVPEAQVVERGGLRRQTGLDVAQTLAVGQLRKGHTRKCSVQASSFTWRSSPCRSTMRVKVVQGRKSISCANNVLPMFIAASGRTTGRLPEPPFAVQIDTTRHRFKSRSSSWFPDHGARLNRTRLSIIIKF
jgi:hypothetical protein